MKTMTEQPLGWGEDALYLYEDPYPTINGEGTYIGNACVFVRLQGCRVGCTWCDAMSTWPGEKGKKPIGKRFTFLELATVLSDTYMNIERIWWTGGEPTEYSKDIVRFIDYYNHGPFRKKISHMITSGEIYYKPLLDKIDYLTIDLKPPASKAFKGNSDVQNEFIEPCLKTFTPDQMEFKMAVANTKDDCNYAHQMLQRFINYNVTVQPVMWSEAEVKKQKEQAKWVKDYSLYLQNFQLPAGWPDYGSVAERFLNDGRYPNMKVLCQLHKIFWPGEADGI